jgi:Tol biopolymer transport system component
MWVRDAARHDRLPTLKQLADPSYFPYRYGHALWSYLAGRHGDAVVSRVLRSKARGGVIGRLEEVTGATADEITAQWHASIETQVDRVVPSGPTAATQRGRMELAPALSPDGRRLMFLSERDRLSVDLFMADTTGDDSDRKVLSTAADPHFDSLQYIGSAGAWDSSGERFAVAALSGGDPVLVIIDVARDNRREEIALPGVREAFNPSWAPDGTRIILSGLKGGLSDLFVYTLETKQLQQLTADAFADLQPAWSPDGRTIAFATDRFTTTLDDLKFGPLRIGLVDLSTGIVRALETDDGSDLAPAKQINPQWAPDGAALYFISDRGGTSNVFRAGVSSGELRQVTDIDGGVSGITATSPALAVASSAGTIAFSVYENGRYAIRVLQDCAGCAIVAADALPPRLAPAAISSTAAGESTPITLAALLADASTGLPRASDFPTMEYDDRLRLESVSQPFVGATTGNAFGGPIRASFGATFGDLLRDRQLQTAFRVGTDVDDFAAQVGYTNRSGQWNWGVTAGFTPARFYGARRAIARDEELITRETTSLRYLHQWAGLAARYHFDRSRRLELGGGVRRTGFAWQTVTRVTDADRNVVSRTLDEASAGRPIYLAETQVAFVHDTSVSGPVGPVLGQRLRFEVEPALGGLTYADVRLDGRRYFMPFGPLTVAARVQHVGRYGPNASDPRLTPLVVGLQTLVRGYDLSTFAADECGRSATECSVIDELTGSRLGLMNIELRAPLAGLLTGNLDYGGLPIEVIAFGDAGYLWTRRASGAFERDRFRSIGAGARANLGGIVLELTAARPFDRPGSGWMASFLLRPGW